AWLSFLAAETVGYYLGFGKQAAFWLAALTFVLPLEVMLVLWSTDDSRAGTFAGWLRSLGLKLATPLTMLLSGILVIATVSWIFAFLLSTVAWIVGRFGYGRSADYLRSLVTGTDAPYDRFSFENPWIPLILVVLIPALVIISYRTMANLGRFRGAFAMGYRSRVLALLVLALAGFQLQRVSDRVTVIYLLDQSESIPQATREVMLRYVVEDSRKNRRAGDLASASVDRAGVIIFGREATIEYPPLASELSNVGGALESLFQLRTDATNISSALKLAHASFPEDTAKRIVIVTDGNENLGDAKTIASTLAENGVGIDVVPIQLNASAEVAVAKIGLPSDIRRGQPIEASVVIENFGKADAAGTLRVTRTYGGQTEPLADQEVLLRPGKNVYTFRHEIDTPAAYTYRADFLAKDEKSDVLIQNNSATAYTHVRGKGRVLLIVDPDGRGQFEALKNSLGLMNLEVEEMPSDRLFTTLAELQAFDCVVLANVPRSQIGATVEDIDKSSSFTDEQIQMLVRNTEQFGCGLVMIGGPDSFGAGGWANTELEKAMPVDFQIKNAKVRAVGALVMMMHACEIPQGNHWQKVIGIEALKVLGPMDYCGVVHWDNFIGRENWLWRDNNGKGLVRVGGQQKTMMAKLDRMQAGDMPDFEGAMMMTARDLAACNASVKLAIIISDGDPSPPTASIRVFKQNKIKVSTVAVGAHGMIEDTRLRGIATDTGGKFYRATNHKALPRIFQIEARRVARPLVKEDKNGIAVGIPSPARDHEMVQNIDNPPPTEGFVLTEVKENPLVEVLMQANVKDVEAKNATILATWTYGAGKTAVVTTDAGARWAKNWPGWENYDKFYSQVIRNVMRPVNELGDFTIATDVKDGEVRVVVQALQKDTGENLNFLNMSAAGSDPKMGTINFTMQQESPGRYVGKFKADLPGSYLLAISPGKGYAPLLTGASVPYSAEYRERETNEALLLTLASLKPKGGLEKGKLFETDLRPDNIEKLTLVDTFRRTLPKAISSRDVWPLFLLIAAGVFLTDVFIRRVTVHFYWVAPALAWAYNRLLQRPQEQARDEVLERLRSRKAVVTSQIDERRAATRFEPVAEEQAPPQRELGEVLADATAGGSAAPPRPAATPTVAGANPQEETTYTERLLAAKKKAKRDGT
ncbi:MAG TPA: VWA domain-containing protein, partial [Pirellulaceae bacterium]|nr:VWA domain-containing protein [Pirellulaceae bacterium]